MREVLVWPECALNATGQTAVGATVGPSVLRLDRLFERLENRYEQLRHRRHPEDPSLFLAVLYLPEGERWHSFGFVVDDSTAEDRLLVIDLIHRVGSILRR